jgi:hypothetical protein
MRRKWTSAAEPSQLQALGDFRSSPFVIFGHELLIVNPGSQNSDTLAKWLSQPYVLYHNSERRRPSEGTICGEK